MALAKCRSDAVRLLLVVAVLASSLKIRLPGLDGTMSVNFLFILLSILELNLPETLVLAAPPLWRNASSERAEAGSA